MSDSPIQYRLIKESSRQVPVWGRLSRPDGNLPNAYVYAGRYSGYGQAPSQPEELSKWVRVSATSHLWLWPGDADFVRVFHTKFMNWDQPILTDSRLWFILSR